MAKTAERKLEIAARLVAFCCDKHGLPQSDLMIDPLVLTVATGNEDDRKLALWTLQGIQMIHDAFPDVQIVLGLSNVSFGLNAAARAVLNSVFLDLAVKAGMTAAIVHVRQDQAVAPDLRGGSAGSRRICCSTAGARATTRCTACWSCSPTASWPTPPRRCGPPRWRAG